MEFKKWPSIPRLSKERMVITEKLDGTNACVVILPASAVDPNERMSMYLECVNFEGDSYYVWAQSRTRFIYPTADNYGFASWVHKNAEALVQELGPGYHYGEWWGSGVQRGYNMTGKRFSLFNAVRWQDKLSYLLPRTSIKELFTVPLLYAGPVDWSKPEEMKKKLLEGSIASPTFKKAEGMVIYLREADTSYKVLLENDDLHKWQVSE